MADGLLETPIVTQVAIIVQDIEKTAQAFAKLLGVEVPEWHLTDPQDQTHARYRGEPTGAQAKLAFFHLGGLSLELIEPVGGPSTWQEFLETHGEGVHHLAFRVKDMDQSVANFEANGMPLVQRGDFTGGCYAYIDTSQQLKVMIELLQY